MQRYLKISEKERAEITTPYKSNGGHNFQQDEKGQKTLLFVDKFEVTLKGSFLSIGEGGEPATVQMFADGDVVLERSESMWNGSKHYQYGYNIYLHGEPFASILICPRASILDAGLSQLKIENHILYQRGWIVRFEAVLKALGAQINNFTNIDVAADGTGFLADYKRMLSGDLVKVGRASFRTEHKHNGDVEGFYIGRKDSERFIRGYRKSDELKKDGVNKQYISDAWKRNGLQAPDVDRLELSLRSKAIKRLEAFDWVRLEQQDYLAGILRAEFNKFYQFVDAAELEQRGNITKCEKLEALDWEQFTPAEIEKAPKVNKPSATWAAKQRIRFDMMEYYCKVDKADTLFNQTFAICYQLSREYGITDWFEQSLPKWEKANEFHTLMREARQQAQQRKVFYLKDRQPGAARRLLGEATTIAAHK